MKQSLSLFYSLVSMTALLRNGPHLFLELSSVPPLHAADLGTPSLFSQAALLDNRCHWWPLGQLP